jgi:hypothetical protein
VSDAFELSDQQRGKLLAFISRADASIGDGAFDPETASSSSDAELMALALKAATLLGYEGTHLEKLFQREFEIAGVTEGDLGTWLDLVMLADVESRIGADERTKCECGIGLNGGQLALQACVAGLQAGDLVLQLRVVGL